MRVCSDRLDHDVTWMATSGAVLNPFVQPLPFGVMRARSVHFKHQHLHVFFQSCGRIRR
jgi:hypothetical protein